MQTSAQGVAALEFEEGVVLRAYRDPVGVWTIGAGLTAASGVVKPRAGMQITKVEATRLLELALRTKYEPSVVVAMPGAKLHEFDAGVGFHWNTGAIRTATWVRLWREKARRMMITVNLLKWNKAGGKVLPGLTHRRARESDMLFDARYPVPLPSPRNDIYATWALPLSGREIEAAIAGFRSLGFDPGPAPNAVLRIAVDAFQSRHGLTVDGIIGRATLSTLQRMLDARGKAAVAAPAVAAATPVGTTDIADQLVGVPYAGVAILGLTLLIAGYLAFTYRDAIAARITPKLPRLAAILRSF
jgi:lysozyme